MKMLIDTHAHLDFWKESELEELLKRASKKEVKIVIAVGTDLASSEKAAYLAQKFKQVYASIGVHPHEAKNFSPHTHKSLKKLAKCPKVVAIGETGLDFFKNYSPQKTQIKVLKEHIRLAQDLNLPLILHTREALGETIEILKEENFSGRALFHCFSQDFKEAENLIKLEYILSFAGNITFKKAKNLQETVVKIPPEKFVIETDAPYLSPHPYRGKTNEPANLTFIAQKIAELKNTTFDEIASLTTTTALQFFNIIS